MRFTTDTIWTLSFTDTRPFWKYGSYAGTKNPVIDSERGTTLMGYNAEVCGHMIKELRESPSAGQSSQTTWELPDIMFQYWKAATGMLPLTCYAISLITLVYHWII